MEVKNRDGEAGEAGMDLRPRGEVLRETEGQCCLKVEWIPIAVCSVELHLVPLAIQGLRRTSAVQATQASHSILKLEHLTKQALVLSSPMHDLGQGTWHLCWLAFSSPLWDDGSHFSLFCQNINKYNHNWDKSSM